MNGINDLSENETDGQDGAPIDAKSAAVLSFELYLKDKLANRNELVRLVMEANAGRASLPLVSDPENRFFWYDHPDYDTYNLHTPDMKYEAQEVLAFVEGFEKDYSRMAAAGVDTIEEVPEPQNYRLPVIPASVDHAEVAHILEAAVVLWDRSKTIVVPDKSTMGEQYYQGFMQIFLSQINPATRLHVARPASERPIQALEVGQDVFFTVRHVGDFFRGTVVGTGDANTLILESEAMGRVQVPPMNVLGVAFPAVS